jgi:hypothetical protein
VVCGGGDIGELSLRFGSEVWSSVRRCAKFRGSIGVHGVLRVNHFSRVENFLIVNHTFGESQPEFGIALLLYLNL